MAGQQIAQRRRTPRHSTSSALALLARGDSGPTALDAEVIEAELVEGTAQPMFDALSIDAVLDAYLDCDGDGHGWRLVPARHAELTALPSDLTASERGRRLERARALDEMRAGAWADGTLLSYGGHVRAWQAWCRAEGIPALPFDPEQVANHLIDYAFAWDFESDEWARDRDGGMLPVVSASTVGGRLAALNKAAEFIGLPRPGDNAGVAEVMRGIRRRLLVAPEHRKAALDLKLLTRCLAAVTGATFVSTRNRVAVLLRARTSATAGQLAKLGWADLTLQRGQVVVELAPAHKHGASVEVVVTRHSNPDLCLVAALHTLRGLSPRLAAVLTHPDGKPLSRQALHLAVSGATPAGWDGLPDLSDRQLAPLLERSAAATPLAAARDRALLLVGFYTALRRSNLSALNWRDMTDHGGEEGWSARIRRSKTDQEGRGRTSWIPQAAPGSHLDCPATALRTWHAQVSAALGRAPHPDEPVFASLTGRGTLKIDKDGRLTRLPGEGINLAVQRLTVAAGLAPAAPKPDRAATQATKPAGGTKRRLPEPANKYGAHSLRAGFVTEALRDDKLTIGEVQDVTGHANVEVLMMYRREVNAASQNGSRKLLGKLGKTI